MSWRAGFVSAHTGPSDSGRFPDTGVRFTSDNAPGIGEQTDFFRVHAGFYMAWAGDPNVPALELGVEGSRHNDRVGGRYSFNRLSVDARGFLPLGSRQRTLAARVFVSRDIADSGARVTFYLMETLGCQETLRGFRDFRFRDANVLYLSGEYRWEATNRVDLAFSFDTGRSSPMHRSSGSTTFDTPSASASVARACDGRSFGSTSVRGMKELMSFSRSDPRSDRVARRSILMRLQALGTLLCSMLAVPTLAQERRFRPDDPIPEDPDRVLSIPEPTERPLSKTIDLFQKTFTAWRPDPRPEPEHPRVMYRTRPGSPTG